MNQAPQIEISVKGFEDESSTELRIDRGRPVFIVGRNGVGKSALMHYLQASIATPVAYFPGSRHVYFETEALNITKSTRQDYEKYNRQWDYNQNSRWRSERPQNRNEKSIYDLISAETQFKINAANKIAEEGAESSAISLLQSLSSPFDRVNSLFRNAGLPVTILMADGDLRASRSGSTYSHARMSDGERAALILAAEVASAPMGATFVIDEPELHLHRAIVVPLIKSFIAERQDCSFIIATHELELPATTSCCQLVLVRGSQLVGSEFSSWDLDIIPEADGIPDHIRTDVLGSRRKILFIEGISNSLDQPLYELLFPDISVRPRETCRAVMQAVDGLRASDKLHHIQAFGLVDRDGMSASGDSSLEARGLFPLSAYSVEGIYYSLQMLEHLANRQAETLGLESAELIATAVETALAALRKEDVKAHLASRLAERVLRDVIFAQLPDRCQLSKSESVKIEIPSPYGAEMAYLTDKLANNDYDSIVHRYPIRETAVLNKVASALHFSSRGDYERAALIAVGRSDQLRSQLKKSLGSIAPALTAE